MANNVERSLEGTVALVTGGTRGIGGATSLLLAKEGMRVFATFRDPKKQDRVREFVGQAQNLPGLIIPVLSDITRPTHREELVDTILLTTGKCRAVDVLVSNAAGGIDKQNPLAVNSTAKIALIRELAPLLSPRALVVEMESAWSRFYPYVEQLPEYEPVAESKKRGRERLLREIPVMAEATEKEIGLAFVCGHAVDGTVTTTDDMAQAVLRAVHRFQKGDLEFGSTEYVGIPHWDEGEVKKRFYMYGPASLYVKDTVFHSPTQSFTSTRARQEHFEPLFSQDVGPLDYRRTSYSETSPCLLAEFMATEEHARDHFTEQTGLQIVPGYKLVEAAAKSHIKDQEQYFMESFAWAGILGETHFIKPVLPGAKVEVYNRGGSVTEDGGWASNIELRAAGTSVVTISGLLMKPGVDRNRHLKGRFIEMAAQAAGAQFLHSCELAGDNPIDLVPLFRGIGQIRFMGVVQEGETIETESRLTEVRRNGFTADTVLRVGDRTIATISGIDCRVLRGGMRVIERIIKSTGERGRSNLCQ